MISRSASVVTEKMSYPQILLIKNISGTKSATSSARFHNWNWVDFDRFAFATGLDTRSLAR